MLFDEQTVWCMFLVLLPGLVGVFPAIQNFAAYKTCCRVVFVACSAEIESSFSHLEVKALVWLMNSNIVKIWMIPARNISIQTFCTEQFSLSSNCQYLKLLLRWSSKNFSFFIKLCIAGTAWEDRWVLERLIVTIFYFKKLFVYWQNCVTKIGIFFENFKHQRKAGLGTCFKLFWTVNLYFVSEWKTTSFCSR